MKPQEIQTIHDLLVNRVVPQSAREGVAIMALAQKLVSHFASPPAPPQATPTMVVHPTQPPEPTPDPTPDPPR
jgi:hypothetical protein